MEEVAFRYYPVPHCNGRWRVTVDTKRVHFLKGILLKVEDLNLGKIYKMSSFLSG